MRSESEHCLGISSQNFWTNGIITAVQVSVKKKTKMKQVNCKRELVTLTCNSLQKWMHVYNTQTIVCHHTGLFFTLWEKEYWVESRQYNYIGEPQLINNYCWCRLILKTLIFLSIIIINNITLIHSARKTGTQRLRVESLYHIDLYM